MFEDSDSDSLTNISSFNDEEIMSESDDDDFDTVTNTFMPTLLPNEELSIERQERMTTQFANVFARRYPSSELTFSQGSFANALYQSIFNPEVSRPLLLYIRHNESVADNVFCLNFFNSTNIVHLLNTEFVIWPWDRTNMDNYLQFLQLLIETVGSQIASHIASYSYSVNQYPLLVCLGLINKQCTTVRIINSEISDEDAMYNVLCLTRDDFDGFIDQEFIPVGDQNNGWHIPNSRLTLVPRESDEFQTVVNSLNIKVDKILNIKKIENLIWSIQYSHEKRRIADCNGHSPDEKDVFYGCPLSMAQNILRNGFNEDTDQIHGDKHGHGFYFTSKQEFWEKYTVPDELKNGRKAVIQCRIFTDEHNSNIFVVNQNEKIHPEYLIVYN